MIKDVYLAGAARTPIGAFGGTLQPVPAPQLGSLALQAALQRSGLAPEHVDEVLFGNVLSAGLGQNVARQVALGAGLASSVGATTLNKVCGSGLKAVMLAAQAVQCGDARAVVAGGTENMSRAPYLLEKARNGYRMGHGELIDSLIRDGLWDVYNDVHMGMCGDRCAAKYGFTREQQDDYAVESFRRARAAIEAGHMAEEIVAVTYPDRKGEVTVQEDETPAKFNEEKLRKLRPAFGKEGTVTAGNASSINDGAAAVVVLDQDSLERHGVKPQAKILGYATYSREPEWFTLAPVGAIQKLMEQLGLTPDQVDLFEVNEAFAVVPMAAMKDCGLPHDKVNVRGGAVALGHPIGASGARTLTTLLHALRQRGGRIGIDALCIGGGEAVALAVELC